MKVVGSRIENEILFLCPVSGLYARLYEYFKSYMQWLSIIVAGLNNFACFNILTSRETFMNNVKFQKSKTPASI